MVLLNCSSKQVEWIFEVTKKEITTKSYEASMALTRPVYPTVESDSFSSDSLFSVSSTSQKALVIANVDG